MFKMGGPVKEGVMEGIKEPQATFGVGNNANRDPRTGREKHGFFLAAGIPTALTAARVAIPAALRSAASRLPAFLRPTAGQVTGGGGLRTASEYAKTRMAPMSALEKFRSIPFVSKDPLLMGLSGPAGTGIGGKILGGLKSTAKYSLTTPTGLIGTELLFSPVRKTAKALFGDDPEIEGDGKEKATLPGQDPKGGVNVDAKVEVNEQGGSAPSNQFNDDGTKKDTSVERLLKGIVKRARTDAGADTAIKFGQQLRTGEASIKDPSSVIDVASGEFDKVSDIQKKVDLALIENELKKQQIAAQATATTEKALEIERRKRGMITMGDLVRADKSGMGLTHSGTLGIAREFADLTNKKYRGSIGNDDLLAQFEKNDRFKTDELGVITEKLQGGDDGLYILGTRVYEKSGPIVKLIKT
jgi:hypothetical protein